MAEEGSSGWLAFGVMSLIVGVGVMAGMTAPAEAGSPQGSRQAPNAGNRWAMAAATELQSLGVPLSGAPGRLVMQDDQGRDYISVSADYEDAADEVFRRNLPAVGLTVHPQRVGKSIRYVYVPTNGPSRVVGAL